jgi:hypothetical protein
LICKHVHHLLPEIKLADEVENTGRRVPALVSRIAGGGHNQESRLLNCGKISPSEDGEALSQDLNSTISMYPEPRKTAQTRMNTTYVVRGRAFPSMTVKVLELSGVFSFVGVADPRPAAPLGLGIETLASHLAAPSLEPHPVVIAGQSVRICVTPSSGKEEIVARRKNGFHFGLTLGLLMQSNETNVRSEVPEPAYLTCSLTLKTPLQTENRPYQITADDFNCLDPAPDSPKSPYPSLRSVGRIEGSAEGTSSQAHALVSRIAT